MDKRFSSARSRSSFQRKPTRFHSATAVTDMQVLKIDRVSMIRSLRTNAKFAYAFTTYLLRRSEQIQQDLASSLLNSAAGSIRSGAVVFEPIRPERRRRACP
jgi:CRP-like cAMP-binding protein